MTPAAGEAGPSDRSAHDLAAERTPVGRMRAPMVTRGGNFNLVRPFCQNGYKGRL
jgi:hypothetical protein